MEDNMNALSGLSQADKDEIFLDACVAFATTVINEKEFRETLAKLGYNATDIEYEVRVNAPQP